ncbi:unnamed protein product [Rotaria sp. Silwood2]|nr:unnamed protein product [Rotaria sp. Silwood2]CAF2857380.1 unnamed protein product [Rotaria sp. Silwood2]CAF3092152.1 unnamed protein product [Rotaria sp. Silwood2]CAF3291457.1 unnamed protein product [Rotaria sp. Silwood2]CAF3937398.1 unnamed protein product [Rotaria sp. Silwood2]
MYMITIIIITILIPSVQLVRPTLKLTFIPDEKYMPLHQQVEIKCEVLNPNDHTDAPQLWYVDLTTGKHTVISRSLLSTPPDDSPAVFKNNKNQRYLWAGKHHLRIRSLQPEDSAKYECNCPDCEEQLESQSRNLDVMKLSAPTWIIEPGWPLHENTKTIIRCQVENFYPYVQHKILRNHQEITKEGRSSLSNNNAYPQKFVWEATITPSADWHNSTIYCNVMEGSSEQQSSKVLEVLFAPRFLKCDESQYVDSKKNHSTIECSFSGNPQPALIWLRSIDKKPFLSDNGITIEIKNESYGKYKSIITLDRNKLMSIPITMKINGQQNKTEENYYQQLLTDGFIAQLNVNGNDKDKRVIHIVRDANQIRSLSSNNSTIISFSSMLLSFLLILYINQR